MCSSTTLPSATSDTHTHSIARYNDRRLPEEDYQSIIKTLKFATQGVQHTQYLPKHTILYITNGFTLYIDDSIEECVPGFLISRASWFW